MSSKNNKAEKWWYCEPMNSIIHGFGFDYKHLIQKDKKFIYVSIGEDPDNPIKIPLNLLREYLNA